MPRSQADWIRSFVAQGMTREEIRGLLGCSRTLYNYALKPLKPESEHLPSGGGRPRKKHCSDCGAAPARCHPELAGRTRRGRRCMTCGAMECDWILDDPDRTGQPTNELRAAAVAEQERLQHEAALAAEVDAGIEALLADLQAKALRAKTVASIRKEMAAENARAAYERTNRAVYLRDRREEERRQAVVEPGLRAKFENHGGRMSKELKQKKLQEAGDEWLRKREDAKPLAELEPAPESGVLPWGFGPLQARPAPDPTDYRAELIAAAQSGDEHAQWRASELFGMEFAEEKRCAS